MSTTTEQFSLRWNNFHSNLTSGFHELLEAAEMVDVTLAVEGHFLQAHKIVLSICSPYFRQMFKANPCKHPIVILKDVGHNNMKDILEFMYLGEVNVLRENLSNFLRTAELLQVKGLTGDDSSDTSSGKDDKLDNDEECNYQINQLIESDVELPQHFSTPKVIPSTVNTISPSSSSSPPTTSTTSTTTTTTTTTTTNNYKKHRNLQNNPNIKRSKVDNLNVNNSSNKTSLNLKNDQETTINNGKSNVAEESEYLETSFSHYHIDKSPNENEDNKDNIRQIFDNSNVAPSGISESDNLNQGKPETKCNNRHTYQCQKCYKKFSRRDHLRTHEKNIHGEDAGPFVCVICSQLYKNTESLRKHIAKFHFPKINELNSKVEVKV